MKDIVRNVRAAAKEINHGNKETLNNLYQSTVPSVFN